MARILLGVLWSWCRNPAAAMPLAGPAAGGLWTFLLAQASGTSEIEAAFGSKPGAPPYRCYKIAPTRGLQCDKNIKRTTARRPQRNLKERPRCRLSFWNGRPFPIIPPAAPRSRRQTSVVPRFNVPLFDIDSCQVYNRTCQP